MKLRTTLALLLLATGCSLSQAAQPDKPTLVVGYQSKTINTVTAGTLLRSLGYLERRLPGYRITWQDYDTGAPITAQMIAGKIDIGSMGDYPLLINASRSGGSTQMVAITGYNLRGGLNMVVVPPDSTVKTLADLEGAKVSASVGSAGHGTLVQALEKAGVTGVEVVNHQPPVGASALQSGAVQAYAQFVAWPGLLAFQGQGRLIYDGSALDVPTFHGTVVRKAYAQDRPDVVDAFLKAQIEATRYLHENPLKAAELVAKETGLPAEVVYLYNGRNGIATFDTTLKPRLRAAHEHDVPYLKQISADFGSVDLAAFYDDSYLRKAYGQAYDSDTASTKNPAAITGTDPVCGTAVSDPALASEVWIEGAADTQPAASPTCLLRQIAAATGKVRAAYVPDAATGTRWFADKAVWVRDGDGFLPFTTQDGAAAHLKARPGATEITYADALKASGDGR